MARHWRGVLFDTGCRKPHGAAIGPSGAPHHLECSAMGRTVALPRPGTLTMLPHGVPWARALLLLLLRVELRAHLWLLSLRSKGPQLVVDLLARR